jgi:hypothetical protein
MKETVRHLSRQLLTLHSGFAGPGHR